MRLSVVASLAVVFLIGCCSFLSPVAWTQDLLLKTSLDSEAAITSPDLGIGGVSSLQSTDFVDGQVGQGVMMVRAGLDCGNPAHQSVSFPTEDQGVQNAEFDQGEIQFWYYPNYSAGASEDTHHTLFMIGVDGVNPPLLSLIESDRLTLTAIDPDWNIYAATTEYHQDIWSASEWVKVRAVWDKSNLSDSLRIYINDIRVDGVPVPGGWDLGADSEQGTNIFVGASNECGDSVADGIMDEFSVYSAPQADPPTPTETPTVPVTDTPTGPPQSTPTETPTTGDTPTKTPTRDPSQAGITDPSLVITPAILPTQQVGVPFIEPGFNTTMIRMTNASQQDGFATHIYSQLQAFSYDGAYLLVSGEDYEVLRMSDAGKVEGLQTAPWNAPRWHPILPHIIVHYDSNEDTTLRVQYTDVDTQQTTTVFTFPSQYLRIYGARSFDELSKDGKWMAGMASIDGQEDPMIFALNLETFTLGAQLSLADLYAQGGPCQPDTEWGNVWPDWIGVSPLGNYLVVQWERDWGPDSIGECNGLEAYDLETGEFLGRIYPSHQHGDLGFLPDRETEIFMTDVPNPVDNSLPAIGYYTLPGNKVTHGEPTYLLTVDWGVGEHISGQGPAGVFLVGTGGDHDSPWHPFKNELFLLYTDGSVLRLGHTRTSSCGYWVQPRASISDDGRYVVWTSDWSQRPGENSCTGQFEELGQGDVYVIDLGPGSESPTPTATQTGGPMETPTVSSDINHDGVIDEKDLLLLLNNWRK